MPTAETLAAQLARRHGAAFAPETRAWSADEFGTLLASPHVYLVDSDHTFSLIRVVADEAEILTLATDQGHRRQGLAQTLLQTLEVQARDLGAARLFLEVSAANAAALALYDAAGFIEVARRPAYYRSPDGARHDALILRKEL